MSYTIQEIKVAAYNWTELPGMSIRERALWESLGYWYEEYRAVPDSRAECQKNVDSLVELFLNLESKEYA